MGRFFLLLLVVLGVALWHPDSRGRILEAVGPLANPAYRWMSHQEMNQIVEDLEIHLQTGGSLPLARGEFDSWMNRRYPQERSRMDAWGVRYQLQVRGDRFQVISAGPDGAFGTEDDLIREGSRNPRTVR
jgi:hypothetical protein